MDASVVLAIALPVLVALAVLAFAVTSRTERPRSGTLSRETTSADRSEAPRVVSRVVEAEARARYGSTRTALLERPPPAASTAIDPETVGITRRQLFNRGVLAATVVGASGMGAAVLAFLWPSSTGGFGVKIAAGHRDEVLNFVHKNREPFYVPEARGYLVDYPRASLAKAQGVYDDRIVSGIQQHGLMALYQTCPHLGCRVPWCASSQWFECPCHGSKYNRAGEKRGGPAPRGMDRFPIAVDDRGTVTIDTGTIVTGPAIGTNTTGQEPEGPHCV